MKRIIKLTENDLSRIVRRVISEQTSNQLNEGLFDAILNFFKRGGKSVSKTGGLNPKNNMAYKSTFPKNSPTSSPMMSLPSNVVSLLSKIPQKVKIGPVLEKNFKYNLRSMMELEKNIVALKPKINGLSDIYAKEITSILKQPKGSTIDLKKLYSTANYCKIELMKVKSGLPPLKQNFLARFMNFKNYQTEIYRYNNLLSPEIISIDRFIRSLDDLLKEEKFIKK